MASAWPRRLDHLGTLHAEKVSQWMNLRRKRGYPMEGLTVWAPATRQVVDRNWSGWTTGSSGFYCVGVALDRLKIPKVVACGIPMDPSKNYFSARKWKAHRRYLKGWTSDLARKARLPERFRSFSGWTRETFGAPDLQWLNVLSE